MDFLHPSTWKAACGYSNGVAAEGKQIFVAGQIAWDEQQKIVSEDFVEQTAQVLRNIVAVLAEAGAQPEHIVRMTWFIKDKNEYLAAASEIGAAYREVIGKHFPAMSLVQVADLLEEGAKVEIEATAVL